MLPTDIKSKLITAHELFRAKPEHNTQKYLTILDGGSHYIVRRYKKFPLASKEDILLYNSSIQDEVLEVAKELAKYQTSFVASLNIMKSFIFFLDPDKNDFDRYTIKERWVEVLNDCIVGDIEVVAAFARQF